MICIKLAICYLNSFKANEQNIYGWTYSNLYLTFSFLSMVFIPVYEIQYIKKSNNS